MKERKRFYVRAYALNQTLRKALPVVLFVVVLSLAFSAFVDYQSERTIALSRSDIASFDKITDLGFGGYLKAMVRIHGPVYYAKLLWIRPAPREIGLLFALILITAIAWTSVFHMRSRVR